MKYAIGVTPFPEVTDDILPVKYLLHDVEFFGDEWVEEIVGDIDQVLNGKKTWVDTGSNACSIEIYKDNTKVMFYYGNEEECKIETIELRRLIVQWSKMVSDVEKLVEEYQSRLRRWKASSSKGENAMKYVLELHPVAKLAVGIQQFNHLLTDDVTNGVDHIQMIDHVLDNERKTVKTEGERYMLVIYKDKAIATNKRNGYQSEIETVELRRLIEQWVEMKKRIKQIVENHNDG
ncbi:hypothetical protein [Marininema halotolerans]|uniref:Uncharacterized protein n=1 Tax=Marininema halotolerans TaxID=1155944 RepID=A0A1I6UND2_9BACL|nr:hypothetical protein [Marininema halotolerans]SFT02921.1 hypothetical protein SAMN05444972_11847 [Marininema halotolerans]